MKLLKRINQASAILAGLSFLVMVQSIYVAQDCPAYYVSAVIFVVMAAIFVPTAAIFLFGSLLWHIKNRKTGTLLRHYIYAYIGFYLLLMVLNHISMSSISWVHNLVYALVLGWKAARKRPVTGPRSPPGRMRPQRFRRSMHEAFGESVDTYGAWFLIQYELLLRRNTTLFCKRLQN